MPSLFEHSGFGNDYRLMWQSLWSCIAKYSADIKITLYMWPRWKFSNIIMFYDVFINFSRFRISWRFSWPPYLAFSSWARKSLDCSGSPWYYCSSEWPWSIYKRLTGTKRKRSAQMEMDSSLCWVWWRSSCLVCYPVSPVSTSRNCSNTPRNRWWCETYNWAFSVSFSAS